MVGDWLAESMVLEAVFTLSVQPSGRYTAILEGFGLPSSESGKPTVDGAYAVLMPESPPGLPESRDLWKRVGDSVIPEGESEFDFNLDGMAEAATLRQVLIPN